MPPFAVAFLIACVLLAAAALACARLFSRLRAAASVNERFALTMSLAYEDVYELNLTENAFYQYFIINGQFEKTAMPEKLPVYLGRVIRERVYQADMGEVSRMLRLPELEALCSQSGTRYLEYRRVSPKGVPCWCSVVAQGVAAARKRPAFVMLYIRDINESKQREEATERDLREALAGAERLSAAKSNFTSRVSHEIRTPLNAVMGYLTIAHQHLGETERVADCLDKAELASRHLLAIVSDILDAGALESGKMRLDEAPFRLRELVGNLSGLYYEQAKESGVSFRIRTQDVTEDNLVGDDTRIRQILMNLVSNALKFTPKGGHVEALVRQHAVVGETVHIRITVRDDGVGIKPEFLPHLFDPFEQEEAATGRRYGGSGLGLSIVKNLCEMMGGSVQAQSELGKGTVFTVNLPVRRSSYSLPEGAELETLKRLRVLVASGDHSTLQIIVDLLGRLGASYDLMINGSQAARRARDALAGGAPYHLLLMDWELGDREASCRELLALGDARPAIAAIANQSVDALRGEAERAGVHRVISRPLTHETLLDVLRKAAARAATGADADAGQKARDLGGARVLLVEDNRLNREIGRELLESFHAAVDTAEDGQRGVDAFAASPPGHYALVLMDLQMPVMDGFAAAKAIRAANRPDGPTVPIVALTANAFPSDVSLSLASGMNAHLSKPIDPEALYQTLTRYIDQPKREG